MNCTAMAPSPTPEATRLTEPWRTSPATKMPGTLVSRRYGSRSRAQPRGRSAPSGIVSRPARTKPRASHSTTPSSQSVRGAAPMKMNSDDAGTFCFSPVRSFTRVMHSRWLSPSTATTRVWRSDAARRLRGAQLHAGPLGLHHRPAGQVRAAEALRKTEIVLDARAGTRLAARGFALDHQRAQPLGSAVDRRGQAGGARAD